MKKNLKLLVSSAIIGLAFSVPQSVHSMEPHLERAEQQDKRQMFVIDDDTLGSILGTGRENIQLKMSMDLKTLKTTFGEKQIEVPVHLFVNDKCS